VIDVPIAETSKLKSEVETLPIVGAVVSYAQTSFLFRVKSVPPKMMIFEPMVEWECFERIFG